MNWGRFALAVAVLAVLAVPIGFGAVAVLGPDWGPMVATAIGCALGPALIMRSAE